MLFASYTNGIDATVNIFGRLLCASKRFDDASGIRTLLYDFDFSFLGRGIIILVVKTSPRTIEPSIVAINMKGRDDQILPAFRAFRFKHIKPPRFCNRQSRKPHNICVDLLRKIHRRRKFLLHIHRTAHTQVAPEHSDT